MSRHRRTKGPLPHLKPCAHCDTDQPPERACGRGGGGAWVCRGCGAPREQPEPRRAGTPR